MSYDELNVVFGFDCSPRSRFALEQALGLAAADKQTRLHIVHVLDDGVIQSRAEDTPIERRAAALEEHRRRLYAEAYAVGRPAAVARFTVEALIGDPVDELLAYASAVNADWIAQGEPSSSLLPPSAGQRLTLEAPCPVLVLRPNELSRIPPLDRVEAPREPTTARSREDSELPGYEPQRSESGRLFSAWGASLPPHGWN